MLYEDVLNELSLNKQRRRSGDVIAIPWSLPRLSTVLPGIEQGRYNLISASPKAGKCLGKDTLIRMFDNTLKKVQDIQEGDKLLNPSGGSPNLVLSTCKGIDKLYKVSQSHGINYIVNSAHILSLKSRMIKSKKYPINSIINIPIEDYLDISTTTSYRLKGYRSELIEFDSQTITIDPYWLGLWLGDGDKDGTTITNIDKEVIGYIYNYASKINLKVSIYKSKNHVEKYAIVNDRGKGNLLKQQLQEYNLLYNKHIPNVYKTNSRDIRLKLLAGIIDTDGHVSYRSSGSIDLTLKSERLINDIIDICYSLGYRIHKSIRIINNTNYFRIRISGNKIDEIPLRVKHKKDKLISNKKKDLSTSSLSIKSIGIGSYYGFSLTGNRLFCLEDYTVTHNTQLADFLYVYQPVEWIDNNPTSDITLKIFYFSLEVSKENKIKAAMCYKLYKDYGILISPQKLSSIFSNYILDDKIEEIIKSEKFSSWFTKFNSIVTYYDSIRSPNSIFHLIKSYAEHPSNGKYTYKTISWQNEDKTYTPREVRDKYIPARPNEYVIILVDHISLLQTSTGETLHQTINRFSNEYCLEMRDKWKYIPTIVQQQSADSSRAQFNYRGDTIIDKIKPDSEGLSDSKYTARDVDLMISLFYPKRYNIPNHEGVDLNRIGDSHREFMINLNRNGISNASIQLLFLGSSSYFEELPRELSEFDYLRYEDIIKKQI